MALREFLVVQSDNRCWVITYNPDNHERKLLGLKEWIDTPEAPSVVEAPEQWLESNGSTIEAVFSIQAETRSVDLNQSKRLEYTELLDDLEVY